MKIDKPMEKKVFFFVNFRQNFKVKFQNFHFLTKKVKKSDRNPNYKGQNFSTKNDQKTTF